MLIKYSSLTLKYRVNEGNTKADANEKQHEINVEYKIKIDTRMENEKMVRG